MYNSATLVPAYGRDYQSKASLMDAWQHDQDFYIVPAPTSPAGYVNRQQLPQLKEAGITHLHFRYNKQRQVHVVKL